MSDTIGCLAAIGLAFAWAACGGRTPPPERAEPARCRPAVETELEGYDAEDLAGEYVLTLVATGGAAAGGSTTGRLWLYPNDPDMRSLPAPAGGVRPDATAPLYGAADVDVEPVGAVRLGELMSRDPEMPGVLVVEQDDGIVLRLGSEANRRGLIRFDGGYFALRVRRMTDTDFAGSWASGVTGPEARGHFCARAITD